MPSVKDINGKVWEFTVNTASLARVKEGVKWDLLSVAWDKASLPRLYGDPGLLVDCLFYLCGSRVGQLTLDSWRENWAGDCLDNAYEAVCEGLIDFFPSSRRATVKDLIRTYDEITAAAREMAPAEMEQAKNQTLDLLKKGSGEISGNSPESSESTPENTPSDNSTG